jgi:hypothetical protein
VGKLHCPSVPGSDDRFLDRQSPERDRDQGALAPSVRSSESAELTTVYEPAAKPGAKKPSGAHPEGGRQRALSRLRSAERATEASWWVSMMRTEI